MADVIHEDEALALIDAHGHKFRIGPSFNVLIALIRRLGPKGIAYATLSDLSRDVDEVRDTVKRKIRSLTSSPSPYVRRARKSEYRGMIPGYRIVRKTLNGHADDQVNLWRPAVISGTKRGTLSPPYAPPVKIYLPCPVKINDGKERIVVPPRDWRVLRSWPPCYVVQGFGYEQVSEWVKCAAADLDQSPHLVPLVADGVRISDHGIPCAILHKPDGNAALFRYAQPTPELVRQLGRMNGEIQRLREELRRNDLVDSLVRIAGDYGT